MRKRFIGSALVAGAAGVAAAAAVGSAGAATQTVTIGSVLGNPSGDFCNSINCTYVPFQNNSSTPVLKVPFDGTVTSFSIKSASMGNTVELRVLRPSGGNYTGVESSPPETLNPDPMTGITTFNVSLPVRNGDVLGIDNSDSAIVFDTSDSTYFEDYWEPALANGATLAPTGTLTNQCQATTSGCRLLLEATVQTSTTTTTGTTGTTGTTTNTTPPVPPPLTNVKQSHRRWREGSKLARFASASRPPVGTTFRFNLNESATVRFAFKQQKCGHKCARGVLSYAAAAGAHKLSFQGRISRKKRLPPGRYKLTITASNGAAQTATAKLSFTIVAP